MLWLPMIGPSQYRNPSLSSFSKSDSLIPVLDFSAFVFMASSPLVCRPSVERVPSAVAATYGQNFAAFLADVVDDVLKGVVAADEDRAGVCVLFGADLHLKVFGVRSV